MQAWVLPLIVLAIVLVWMGSAAAAASYGGWSSLARDYRATQVPPGERFRFATVLMGDDGMSVSYGGSSSVTIGDAGIGLSIGFPQRLFSPPLFIPWRTVATVEVRRSKIFSDAVIRLHGRDKIIRLRGSVGDCALRTWARVGIPTA